MNSVVLLEFRKNYPDAPINLDELTMYFEASKAVLMNQYESPTSNQIIEFAKVVVASVPRRD
ncbi:hypothetical protein SAMN05660461_6017 [Chitinophaga ginsengisegetis]|uniref:Uncharacterized protein n=1 Tax=Chitinophaga ginsengisegetis TaxID=393003 RepID=A0A1T5PBZ9_9BACT|nr:hypothetical protein SAMN05660461_6017 [Chitinophaga ginsengisegetis]